MKKLFSIVVLLGLVGLAALAVWRFADHWRDRAEMARLLATQPWEPVLFSRDMVAGLPKPAQRFFAFAIREGTPLWPVAKISMQGKFSLGTKKAPNYMAMSATQVLAAPEGFVWKMAAKSSLMRVSGSDSGTWTRFWLAGLLPVARAGSNRDHARSAYGRAVSEAVFWTPAAVLPGPDVTWKAMDDESVRVIVTRGDLSQEVILSVDAVGKPVQVVFPRWTNANADKAYRVQPFGGTLSEFRTFGGYQLPTHVEAGNGFGTPEYFPFFIADVTDIAFPSKGKTK